MAKGHGSNNHQGDAEYEEEEKEGDRDGKMAAVGKTRKTKEEGQGFKEK